MTNNHLIDEVNRLLTVEHFDVEVRKQLRALGPDAWELLRQYATGSHPSGNADIQGRAIIALGESGAANVALPALTEALESPDPDTRVRAMRSLGRLGGPKAVQLLRNAVERTELMTAEKAHGIRALAMINSDEARATLSALRATSLPKSLAGELGKVFDENER